jgi:hypothetical protein
MGVIYQGLAMDALILCIQRPFWIVCDLLPDKGLFAFAVRARDIVIGLV